MNVKLGTKIAQKSIYMFYFIGYKLQTWRCSGILSICVTAFVYKEFTLVDIMHRSKLLSPIIINL